MDFKISLVQMNAIHSNKEVNLTKINNFVNEAVKKKAKIICFPELSTCGYDRKLPITLAEEIPGYTSSKLMEIAINKKITIIAGMLEKERNHIYITQILTFPSGKIEKYRKTHLGKYEKNRYLAGEELPVFNMRNFDNVIEKVHFSIGICYDLHFPEVITAFSVQGAQIVFAPHASPMTAERRVQIWNKYMGTRAYDNRVYLAACNLVGNNGFKSFGGGMGIWDPFGNLVKEYKQEDENIIFFDLNLEELNNIRKGKSGHMKKPFYIKDRRAQLYSKYIY